MIHLLHSPLAIVVGLLVLAVAAWKLATHIPTIVSAAIADGCPEENCRGHLHFERDSESQGQKAAIWACDRCDCEVMRLVHGQDIVRSADPNLSG